MWHRPQLLNIMALYDCTMCILEFNQQLYTPPAHSTHRALSASVRLEILSGLVGNPLRTRQPLVHIFYPLLPSSHRRDETRQVASVATLVLVAELLPQRCNLVRPRVRLDGRARELLRRCALAVCGRRAGRCLLVEQHVVQFREVGQVEAAGRGGGAVPRALAAVGLVRGVEERVEVRLERTEPVAGKGALPLGGGLR